MWRIWKRRTAGRVGMRHINDDEVSEERSDTSHRGRDASPRKIPCKTNINMF